MADKLSYSIKPATYADIDALNKIWRDSFETDRQTQLKKLGNVPYLREDGARDGAIRTLQNPKFNYIKAVRDDTGEVLGSLCFVFHGFDQNDIPKLDIGDPSSIQSKAGDEKVQCNAEPLSEQKKRAAKIVDSLDAMETEDMKRWQAILMPPGSKCI